MLKKTITYKDFDDNEQTDTLWFNLTQPEIMRFDRSFDGGLDAQIKSVVSNEDVYGMMEIIEKIIQISYGERVDSKRFVKSPEITRDFTQTAAYTALFMELSADPEKMGAFINGIIPSDLLAKIKAAQQD